MREFVFSTSVKVPLQTQEPLTFDEDAKTTSLSDERTSHVR